VSSRTLVITLGQLRAHKLTWDNFKKNLLDQLGADLAVCGTCHSEFDFTNQFYVNAKYRWLVPDAPDIADLFDRIQQVLGTTENWRVLCDVQGNWIGRIAESRQPGAAALLYVLRWFMLDNIRAAGLTEQYDRFVITRSDFFFQCLHPPLECLDPEYLWIPDGEDYLGLCDRHLVVSAADLVTSCNLIEDMLCRPRQLRDCMVHSKHWNIEQVIADHYRRHGLADKVRRFPYVMYLVRDSNDPTSWSEGAYDHALGMNIKYRSELYEAQLYSQLIRSNDDWRFYTACKVLGDVLPLRMFTTHGTVVYFDEGSGLLRHGNIAQSPANAFFLPGKTGCHIVQTISESANNPTGLIALNVTRNGSRNPDDSADPTTIERVEVYPKITNHKTLVGLRSGGHFVCAEGDGRITLNRERCGLGEQFRLMLPKREQVTSLIGDVFAGASSKLPLPTAQHVARGAESPSASQ
jgi:hypothetical protein